MSDEKQTQKALFEKIREVLPKNMILVDVVAGILDISTDSAYRRIRTETALSIDEAKLLTQHFSLSLDNIAAIDTDSLLFNHRPFIQTIEDVEQYLSTTLDQLMLIQSQNDSKIIYSAKDIPIFYFFRYPELGAFKMYVWLKSMFDIKKIDGEHFDLNSIPQSLLDTGKKLSEYYIQTSAVELWTDGTINSILNQIEYYYYAGLLNNKKDTIEIIDQLQELVKLIYKQALTGYRTSLNDIDTSTNIPFSMYYNEIVLMDNTVLASTPNMKMFFTPYAGLNFMNTQDEAFCNKMESWFENQAKKSSLISDVSEKDRNRFFLKMRQRINNLKDKINTTESIF